MFEKDRINFYISKDMKGIAKKIAKNKGIPLSSYIEQTVIKQLKKDSKKK